MDFVAEDGEDTGGITREFFRLLASEIQRKYFSETGCMKHNIVAFQVICVMSGIH